MTGIIDNITRILLLLTLFVLMPESELSAQFSRPANRPALSASVLAKLPASKPGDRITTKFVDPFMTTQQAEQIFQFLNEPYEFEWGSATTLRDIHRDLSRHLSIVIDFAALEEIGIASDEAIYPELAEGRSPRSDAVSDADPFSDASSIGDESLPTGTTLEMKINENATVANKRNSETRKWWRGRQSEREHAKTVSNGARLFYFLDRLDLTLNVQLGRLAITTWERAEQFCCIRVFEVTPLVEEDEWNEIDSLGSLNRDSFHDYQSLIDLIQTTVVPETWEALGGPSTISSFSTRNRCWLVVSTPLVQHWKINALLRSLNE